MSSCGTVYSIACSQVIVENFYTAHMRHPPTSKDEGDLPRRRRTLGMIIFGCRNGIGTVTVPLEGASDGLV